MRPSSSGRRLRSGEGLVGRDRSVGPAEVRPAEARLIVDTKHIPGIIGIREESGVFRRRRRDPRRRDQRRPRSNRLGRAWSRRRPDRLDADPGPRLDRRQSVQRLAGRRQRAGADRRARDRGRRRPERHARGPGREIVTGPGRTSLAKDEFIVEFKLAAARSRASATPICASSRAPRWTSRWSAPASTSRWTRTAPAPMRASCLARWRRPRSWSTDAAQALIGHKLDDATLERARCGGAARLQADQRQARHDRIPHQGRRRDGAPRGRNRLRARGRAS